MQNQDYQNNYNPNQNHGYNQADFGYQQWRNPNDFLQNQMIKSEKQTLRKLGNLTGCALIGYVVLQNFWSILISVFGLTGYYYASTTFQTGINILLTLGTILVSFIFFGNKMNQVSKVKNPIPYDFPKNKKLFLLSIPAGLGICMVANYVTSYLVLFISYFGVNLYSPSSTYSSAGFDIFLTYVQVVLVAAFVEEVCLRGFVMGNLKKYGMNFAILISAIVFGIMHGNLVQAPFAFTVGIGLGFLNYKTKSIWTSITIHALNNFISITVSYLSMFMDISTLNLIYNVFMYVVIFGGAYCLNKIIKMTREPYNPYKERRLLTTQQMCKTFFSSPMMIISLIYLFIKTMDYVSIG